MTRDDIIRMARKAGFEKYEKSSLSGNSELDQTLQVGEYPVGEIVFKFAALVAVAEREACEKVCDAHEFAESEGRWASDYLKRAVQAETEAASLRDQNTELDRKLAALEWAAAIRAKGSSSQQI